MSDQIEGSQTDADDEERLSDPSATPDDESTGDAQEGQSSDDIESGDDDVPKPPDEGVPS